MIKKLLVLCFPTYGKNNDIHLNSKANHVVLAPDEFNKYFSKYMLDFDVVSLTDKKLDFSLMDSGIVPKSLEEINVNDYKFVWHMFRDPTQPEVLEKIKDIDFSNNIIINNVNSIKSLFKENYYGVLGKYDLAPKVFDLDHTKIKWNHQNFGTLLSEDKKYICSYSYNNNRGDYVERETKKKFIAEYIDNTDENGNRSFFRIGYAYGKFSFGWMYYGTEYSLKSGNCKIKKQFNLDPIVQEKVTAAMKEIGVDVCHVEGLFKDNKAYIFDINPYPTASGNTLSAITEELSKIIIERINNE